MTKTFSKDTLLSIDGFIYLVDKGVNAQVNDRVFLYDSFTTEWSILADGDKTEYWKGNWKVQFDSAVIGMDANWIQKDKVLKIIATNNPSLEGVAKIPELDKLKNDVNWIMQRLAELGFKGLKVEEVLKISTILGEASSKKKYTEDDMFKAMNWAITVREISKKKLPILSIDDPDFANKVTERFEEGDNKIKNFLQSLKPSPISIEIEMEERLELLSIGSVTGAPPKTRKILTPKLKDGYVIIKEVKYEIF